MKVAVLLPTKGRARQLVARVTDLLLQEPPDDIRLMIIYAVVTTDHATIHNIDLLKKMAWSGRISQHMVIRTHSDSTQVEGFNMAYRHARNLGADWFVLGADDLVWGVGWLARAFMEDPRAEVIGLNDGHTDIAQYAPHYMAELSFCETHLNGHICPPEYKSWWFDREVCELARRLGVYAPAWGADVEHLHPDWQTADLDDTYREMLPTHDEDKATYLKRKKAYEIQGA